MRRRHTQNSVPQQTRQVKTRFFNRGNASYNAIEIAAVQLKRIGLLQSENENERKMTKKITTATHRTRIHRINDCDCNPGEP